MAEEKQCRQHLVYENVNFGQDPKYDSGPQKNKQKKQVQLVLQTLLLCPGYSFWDVYHLMSMPSVRVCRLICVFQREEVW